MVYFCSAVLSLECLLNAGTPRKLTRSLLSSVPHGVVNVHPGLLPEYRGCSAVKWALFNDARIGNTAHFMDEGYDTGPIIATEWYEFARRSDYPTIRSTVYRQGCLLAGTVLRLIQSTRMTPADGLLQDESQSRFWNPIPPESMDAALAKVASRSYAYLSLEDQ